MCGCRKNKTSSTSTFIGVQPLSKSVTMLSTSTSTSNPMVDVVFAPERVNSIVQVPPYLRHLVPSSWLTPTGYMQIKSQTVTLDSRLRDYLEGEGIDTSWS